MASGLEGIAALFLGGMMLLSTGDVVLRFLNPEWRILGVVEMVQLAFGTLIFLALPSVFINSGNIIVNALDRRMSPGLLQVLVVLGSLASLCFLALIGSQAIALSLNALAFSDETQDLAIPVFYYWIPILVGFGFAFAAEWILLGNPSARREGGEIA